MQSDNESFTKRYSTALFTVLGLAIFLLLNSGIADAAEPPSIRTTLEDRRDDYLRHNPGVPLWPSTCDCVSIAFGFKNSSGYRPVRFRFANAVDYYGGSSGSSMTTRRSTMSAKGPLKELTEEPMALDSEL